MIRRIDRSLSMRYSEAEIGLCAFFCSQGWAHRMEKQLTFSDLKKKVQDFCEARDWDQFHGPKDLAIGVITEASELLEHFRFLSDEQAMALLNNQEQREEIEDELAD